MTDQPHLNPEQVASWAERRLTGTDRAAVEAHLAHCASCRRDASAVALQMAGARRRRRLLQAAPLVAAAALVVLAVVNRPPGPGGDSGPVLRPGGDPEREGIRRLAVFAPADGATVPRGTLRFVWQGDGPDAQYRFTLADAAGGEIWQATLRDSSVVLPDTLGLADGATYLWYVDVLLPSGERATTGIREFTLGP
jgi:hypothetical protein